MCFCAQARGLSREQSAEKNMKAKQGVNKGNQEGISAGARAERDAAALQAKQAANAAKKAAMLAAGQGDAVKEMEARKQAQRDAKKERAITGTQAYKDMMNNGGQVVRELPISGAPGAGAGGPRKS